MSSLVTDPVTPEQKNAVLRNLGWQPEHIVIDVSSGELPPFAPDAAADWITFLGPFLHLTDVEIFHCLETAKAALKSDGRIVFSFLEYDVPQHWQLFRRALGTPGEGPEHWGASGPPRFLNRATLESWALHLGLTLECHYSGEVRWLQPLQSGAVEASAFGQSVAVLARLTETE